MSRTEPLWDVLLSRLLQVLEQKHLTPEDLAKRSGYNLKTVRRTLSGQTKSLEALERLESVVRADLLDCRCPQSGGYRQEAAETGGPISGWEQAARVLGVPDRTLRDHRRRLGDTRKRPWWPNAGALRFWYDELVSGDELQRRAG